MEEVKREAAKAKDQLSYKTFEIIKHKRTDAAYRNRVWATEKASRDYVDDGWSGLKLGQEAWETSGAKLETLEKQGNILAGKNPSDCLL